MGMNFKLAFFETGMTGFLIVTGALAVIALCAVATLGIGIGFEKLELRGPPLMSAMGGKQTLTNLTLDGATGGACHDPDHHRL
jgi:hypothetical protein